MPAVCKSHGQLMGVVVAMYVGLFWRRSGTTSGVRCSDGCQFADCYVMDLYFCFAVHVVSSRSFRVTNTGGYDFLGGFPWCPCAVAVVLTNSLCVKTHAGPTGRFVFHQAGLGCNGDVLVDFLHFLMTSEWTVAAPMRICLYIYNICDIAQLDFSSTFSSTICTGTIGTTQPPVENCLHK